MAEAIVDLRTDRGGALAQWLMRWSRLPIAPTVCGLLVLLAAFFNPLDLEFRVIGAKDTVGLDWQVALKLGVTAVTGIASVLGLLASVEVRRAITTMPGILLVMLSVVFMATSLVALDEVATVCRIAAIICGVYVVFIPTMMSILSLRSVLIMVLIGLTLHMLVSWSLYFAVPSIGVYEEELPNFTIARRMAGTAHPNSVGRVGVLAIIISIALLRAKRMPPLPRSMRWVVMGLIVLGALTTYQTMSRTAMGAGLAAAILMQIDRLFSRFGVTLLVAAATIGLALTLTLGLTSDADNISNRVVQVGTKTGDADELTSATGRTRIWEEAMKYIRQRPLTGWGLNSAPVLLEDFSQHTHNLLLHAQFSGGIFAGILVLALILWSAVVGLTSVEPFVRGICGYVLVSGFFEDTVLETFPFSSTLLWFVALYAPVMDRLVNRTGTAAPWDADRNDHAAGGVRDEAACSVPPID